MLSLAVKSRLIKAEDQLKKSRQDLTFCLLEECGLPAVKLAYHAVWTFPFEFICLEDARRFKDKVGGYLSSGRQVKDAVLHFHRSLYPSEDPLNIMQEKEIHTWFGWFPNLPRSSEEIQFRKVFYEAWVGDENWIPIEFRSNLREKFDPNNDRFRKEIIREYQRRNNSRIVPKFP